MVQTLKTHPKCPEILKLATCISRIADILLERFERDDPLIDEFETLAKELVSIVHSDFEGRSKFMCECHNIDHDGCRKSSREPDGMYLEENPIVRFKFGTYQHNTAMHMVGLMREHGDLIKYSSWVTRPLTNIGSAFCKCTLLAVGVDPKHISPTRPYSGTYAWLIPKWSSCLKGTHVFETFKLAHVARKSVYQGTLGSALDHIRIATSLG